MKIIVDLNDPASVAEAQKMMGGGAAPTPAPAPAPAPAPGHPAPAGGTADRGKLVEAMNAYAQKFTARAAQAVLTSWGARTVPELPEEYLQYYYEQLTNAVTSETAIEA